MHSSCSPDWIMSTAAMRFMCPTSSPWKLRDGTCNSATLFLQAIATTSESAPHAEMLAQYQFGEEGSIVHRARCSTCIAAFSITAASIAEALLAASRLLTSRCKRASEYAYRSVCMCAGVLLNDCINHKACLCFCKQVQGTQKVCSACAVRFGDRASLKKRGVTVC
jgi:hypothetical protein